MHTHELNAGNKWNRKREESSSEHRQSTFASSLHNYSQFPHIWDHQGEGLPRSEGCGFRAALSPGTFFVIWKLTAGRSCRRIAHHKHLHRLKLHSQDQQAQISVISVSHPAVTCAQCMLLNFNSEQGSPPKVELFAPSCVAACPPCSKLDLLSLAVLLSALVLGKQ